MNVNWKTLKKQKETLYQTIQKSKDKKERNHLEGILHLIDHIQDDAVSSGDFTEEEVFGKSKYKFINQNDGNEEFEVEEENLEDAMYEALSILGWSVTDLNE